MKFCDSRTQRSSSLQCLREKCNLPQRSTCREIHEIEQEQGLVDRIKIQRQKFQQLSKEFDLKAELLAQTQSERDRLKDERDSLFALKARCDLYEVQTQRLNYDNLRLKEELDHVASRLKEKENLNQSETIAHLQNEYQSTLNQLSLSEVKLLHIQKSYELLQGQNQELAEKAEFDLRLVKIQISQLMGEKERLVKEKGSLQDQAKTLRASLRNTQEVFEEAKLEANRLKEQKGALQGDLCSMEEKAIILRKQLERIKVEHQRDLCECSIEIEKKGVDIKKLQTTLSQLRIRNETSEAQLRLTHNDNSALAEQQAALVQRMKRLAIELEHEKLRNQKLSQDNVKLGKELKSKSNQLETLEEYRNNQKRVRNELGALRFQTRSQKRQEIQRIDELIRDLDIKHGCNRSKMH